MRTYRKKMVLAAVSGLLSAALLAGCGTQTGERAEDQVWGRADAKEIDVNSKISGRVVELLVKEGDEVHQGDLLARIDDRDLNTQRLQQEAAIRAIEAQILQAAATTEMQKGTTAAALAQAETNLALCSADHERYAALLAADAVSRQSYDTYRARYEAAQAAYESAKAATMQTDVNRANEAALEKKLEQAQAARAQIMVSLDETEIRAPFDGIVTEKYIEAGSMISQGTPLVAVQDPTDNWVDIKVPETKLGGYRLHQSVRLRGRDGTTEVDGVITDISRKSEFATQRATSERGSDADIISFNVKIQVNSPALRPGMRFRLLGEGVAS